MAKSCKKNERGRRGGHRRFNNEALVSDQGFHIKLIVNTWTIV